MDINSDAEALVDVIEELADEGYLVRGSTPYGVALKYAHDGWSSLSPKQKYWVDRVIQPLLVKKSCSACDEIVPPGFTWCADHQWQWDKD